MENKKLEKIVGMTKDYKIVKCFFDIMLNNDNKQIVNVRLKEIPIICANKTVYNEEYIKNYVENYISTIYEKKELIELCDEFECYPKILAKTMCNVFLKNTKKLFDFYNKYNAFDYECIYYDDIQKIAKKDYFYGPIKEYNNCLITDLLYKTSDSICFYLEGLKILFDKQYSVYRKMDNEYYKLLVEKIYTEMELINNEEELNKIILKYEKNINENTL